MDTWICVAESLHCSPETIPTLLISYTPIQNKKLKKIKKQAAFFRMPFSVNMVTASSEDGVKTGGGWGDPRKPLSFTMLTSQSSANTSRVQKADGIRASRNLTHLAKPCFTGKCLLWRRIPHSPDPVFLLFFSDSSLGRQSMFSEVAQADADSARRGAGGLNTGRMQSL